MATSPVGEFLSPSSQHIANSGEYLEEEFRAWLKIKNRNGKPYTEKTIQQYISALKNKTKHLESITIYPTNLFYYTTVADFEEVQQRIKHAPNYETVNGSGHNSYSASMNCYRRFLQEREGRQPAPANEPPQPTLTKSSLPAPQITQTVVSDSAYSLSDILADGCFLEREALEQMFATLKSKKNIILQGPPGTGKTWLAKRLAWALAGERGSEQVQSMQFHATMSYEDFVRGWRPSGDGKLELLDGPFLKFVEKAGADAGKAHIMVIEELNRGNPAQIFGELLTLLEADKRTEREALRLCYQRDEKERLYLPENIYIIGTMNIADRSLALVDFALRRRFAFFDLKPEFGGRWQRWMREHAGLPDAFTRKLAQNMDACNTLIAEDSSLGKQCAIGHSFVTCDREIENPAAWLRGVLNTEILPLLREYWFDSPEKVREAEAALMKGLLNTEDNGTYESGV